MEEKKKRVRATLTQVRALEAQLSNVNDELSFANKEIMRLRSQVSEYAATLDAAKTAIGELQSINEALRKRSLWDVIFNR